MCRVEAVNQKIWNNNLALKRATRQIEWLIDYLIVSLFKLYASVTAIHLQARGCIITSFRMSKHCQA